MNGSLRPRTMLLISVPIFVALVWMVLASMAGWHRDRLIAQLTDQVALGTEAEAATALRLLATMREPAFSPLMGAAVSPRLTTSQAAQKSVDAVVEQWRDAIRTAGSQNHGPIAAQLSALAKALADHRGYLQPANQAWAARTARKILLLANRLEHPSSPDLAAHCESVLRVADLPPSLFTPVPKERAVVVRPTIDRPELLPDFYEPSTQPISETTPKEPEEPHHLNGTQAATARPDPNWHPQWSRVEADSSMETEEPSGLVSQPEPNEFVANQPQRTSGEPVENVEAKLVEAKLPKVELPKASAYGSGGNTIEASRLASLSPELAQQVVSEDVETRLHFLEEVLASSEIDARPWLLLLAEDPAAEVRLAAATVMATSNEPELIEKAWQLALHDRDPRIAALAEQLRKRRQDIRRR